MYEGRKRIIMGRSRDYSMIVSFFQDFLIMFSKTFSLFYSTRARVTEENRRL